MRSNRVYAVRSLELHLFFARIMKEHALFLRAGFLPPNANLAREAEGFRQRFEQILGRALRLSGGTAPRPLLDSGEIVTNFTLRAEGQTRRFTGIPINQNQTRQALNLRPVEEWRSRWQLNQIQLLNRDALRQVEGLIRFKERLLRQLGECALFTGNYPLLIEHILREAKRYRAQILRLERSRAERNGEDLERFWNRIMMEHALFTRGLLDPSEEKLIETADDFAGDYRKLLEEDCKEDRPRGEEDCGEERKQEPCRCEDPLALTRRFQAFNTAGVEGIEDCRIKGLILPLLADHVLRESNHYIRLLERE